MCLFWSSIYLFFLSICLFTKFSLHQNLIINSPNPTLQYLAWICTHLISFLSVQFFKAFVPTYNCLSLSLFLTLFVNIFVRNFFFPPLSPLSVKSVVVVSRSCLDRRLCHFLTKRSDSEQKRFQFSNIKNDLKYLWNVSQVTRWGKGKKTKSLSKSIT